MECDHTTWKFSFFCNSRAHRMLKATLVIVQGYHLDWKKWGGIFQTLKKYWKMGKNTGKVGEFCQPGKVGTILFEYDGFGLK